MNKMANISELETCKCVGCGACVNICPQNAIQMQENNEGFSFPQIDKEKCTNCGLCTKVCGPYNSIKSNNDRPKCYVYMADDSHREISASGGIFSVIAEYFVKNQGYVAGAVWNSDLGVEHIVSDNIDDVHRMCGSKYLQSNINDCYKKIKVLLDNNKKVLFSGTPCQVSALKSFLGSDYNNLYCIDIVCHGISSPKVFKKYISEEVINSDDEVWVNTDFKDKKISWSNPCITTKTNYKAYSLFHKDDTYIKSFLDNYNLRECCGTCNFANIYRFGDITAGDFWKIQNYNKKFNDKKGTSLLLVNNKKGKFLLKILKSSSHLCKRVPLKYATNGNPNLYKPSKLNKNRSLFFNNLDKYSLKENLDIVSNDYADVMILNFWYAVNYGASLTCYGVQCLVEELGYAPKIINYVPDFSGKLKYNGSFSENFAKKYLHLTKTCSNYADLVNLNKYCKTFIVGSDQVFSPLLMNTHHSRATSSIYLLDFVEQNNKKISFSASMGDSADVVSFPEKHLFSLFLKQFDHLSVREQNAVDIFKNNFNISAECFLDGAFYIPKSKLIEMTEKYQNNEDYVFCYVLPYADDEFATNLAKEISEKLNIKLKIFQFNPKTTVEEWLSNIRNAKFVVSNSYHAVIFSIIFNVPFAQSKTSIAQARFDNLFKILNIEDAVVSSTENISFDKILANRNWSQINKKINEEREKAKIWLNNALISPTKDKSEYEHINYLYVKNQLDKEDVNYQLKILYYRQDAYKKYYLYKILSKILFGNLRKTFKKKYINQEKIVKYIRKVEKQYKL
jgi:coenzyme F420-reducing hydrogenase beta subunit